MHRVLLIREILLNIFSHVSPEEQSGSRRHQADLAALARTCQTFKEPALDILWEELFDLSPVVLCLPEVGQFDGRRYSFSRPLSEVEWSTLRGYTRRVKFIHKSLDLADIVTILPPLPFTDPLFPNLRSLFWGTSKALPVEHIIVPSLTWLSLAWLSFPMESFDTIGERCPNIRHLEVLCLPTGPLDAAISRQLGRWTNLQYADCRGATLSMHAILHLPALSTLKSLSFTLSADLGNHITHPGSPLAFSNLARLEIRSISLNSVTMFFSRIQLPKIEDLNVSVLENSSKWAVREYWTTIQRACRSNTLTRLVFSSILANAPEDLPGVDEQGRPCLTLHDLLPYKDFGNLRTIEIEVTWSVNLTDSDVLDLVSTSPLLEELMINDSLGWKMNGEGGITLSGLVQLLRRCPSLHRMSLVIDTRTFTQIPHGLDVSFPPRRTPRLAPSLYCLDSKDDLDCEPVFKALGLSVYYGMDSYSHI